MTASYAASALAINENRVCGHNLSDYEPLFASPWVSHNPRKFRKMIWQPLLGRRAKWSMARPAPPPAPCCTPPGSTPTHWPSRWSRSCRAGRPSRPATCTCVRWPTMSAVGSRRPVALRSTSTRSSSPTASRWAPRACAPRSSAARQSPIRPSSPCAAIRSTGSSSSSVATRRSPPPRWPLRGSICPASSSTADRSCPAASTARTSPSRTCSKPSARTARAPSTTPNSRPSSRPPVPGQGRVAGSSPPTPWRWQ